MPSKLLAALHQRNTDPAKVKPPHARRNASQDYQRNPTKRKHKTSKTTRNNTLTSLNGRISLRDVPGHRGQESDPVLSGRNGVGGRCVHDQAPVLRRRGQIHIIDPYAGPSHHLQPPGGGLEHLPVDLGPAPDDQRVAERDLGAELLGGEVVGAVDVGEVLEEGEPRLPQLLGDEDGGLGVKGGADDGDERGRMVAAAGEEGDGEGGVEGELGGEGELGRLVEGRGTGSGAQRTGGHWRRRRRRREAKKCRCVRMKGDATMELRREKMYGGF